MKLSLKIRKYGRAISVVAMLGFVSSSAQADCLKLYDDMGETGLMSLQYPAAYVVFGGCMPSLLIPGVGPLVAFGCFLYSKKVNDRADEKKGQRIERKDVANLILLAKEGRFDDREFSYFESLHLSQMREMWNVLNQRPADSPIDSTQMTALQGILYSRERLGQLVVEQNQSEELCPLVGPAGKEERLLGTLDMFAGRFALMALKEHYPQLFQ